MSAVTKEINTTVLTDAIPTKRLLPLTALAAAILAVFILFIAPFAAHAAEPISNCKTADGKDGVKTAVAVGGSTCIPINGKGIQDNPIFIYMTAILKVVSGLAGIATVGGFVWGGILYITARANASQTEKAKMVMVNSVIGLLMFIFMYAILQFLVPGGIFT
jgi:hypothetical protein